MSKNIFRSGLHNPVSDIMIAMAFPWEKASFIFHTRRLILAKAFIMLHLTQPIQLALYSPAVFLTSGHLASLSIKYESCYSIDFLHSVTHSPEFQQNLRGRIISDAVCQSRKRSFCSILRCWRVQWQSFSPEIYQAPTVLHMNTNMGKHRVDNADIWDSLSRCRKLRKSQKGSDASSHWWITQASLKITQIFHCDWDISFSY